MININVLLDRFNVAANHIEDLHNLIVILKEEYATGTFTSKLSRNQLFEIAGRLPPRDAWSEHGFLGIREKIKRDFSLSSNDFTRALNVIQQHYELAKLIGEILPLKAANIETFRVFINGWKVSAGHKASDDEMLEKNELNSTMVDIRDKKLYAVCDSVLSQLRTEEIADIVSICRLSDEYFSEMYHVIYCDYLNKFQESVVNCKSTVAHYMRKATLPNLLAGGLQLLRQDTIFNILNGEFKI
ncbi:MAG: hypothetical protein HQM06_17170 [Magnetococcales bacterium]|nr:hypothetical protein [Magnetococcales bacterium]